MYNKIDWEVVAVIICLFIFVIGCVWAIKKCLDIQTKKIEILQDMVNNGAECNDLIKILDVKMD